MRSRRKYDGLLRAVNHYLLFFLMAAFLVTCCMMLFVSTLSSTLEITLTSENLDTAAKLTFWNVLLLSLLFTIINIIPPKRCLILYQISNQCTNR